MVGLHAHPRTHRRQEKNERAKHFVCRCVARKSEAKHDRSAVAKALATAHTDRTQACLENERDYVNDALSTPGYSTTMNGLDGC